VSRLSGLLCLMMIIGCHSQKPLEVESPARIPASTNFERLSILLEGVTSDAVLYEGLPSVFWEPQLREHELREQPTIELHGIVFYADEVTLEDPDGKTMTELLAKRESFQKLVSCKPCSEFHPDYCLVWNQDREATQILISLECGEVEIYGPQGDLHCDLTPTVNQTLKNVLSRYVSKRPQTESAPHFHE
jgi:hypothetical protein